MEELKNALKQIEMPDDMKERIQKNCLAELSNETEGNRMKKRNPMKRTFLIAAVLVLCLPVIGMAVSNSGTFKDIKNIFGTVTGTEYHAAANEIEISAKAENHTLTVTASFPDTVPFSEFEMLAIDAYQIMDNTETILIDHKDALISEIADGQASYILPLNDLEKGTYTLLIDTFTGSKKADQPLPIYGNWKYSFSL